MKKILSIVLLLALTLSLVACGGDATKENDGTKNEAKSNVVTVDGLYVDKSYVDSEDSSLKLLYAFLTINPDEDLSVDCTYSEIKIGDNTYESDFYKSACKYMPNYNYSTSVEDVTKGSTYKIALTYQVPEADLEAGKTITFSDTEIPFDGLKKSTDDIVSCASAEEIAKKVDSEGHAQVAAQYALADEATKERVADAINGETWEFVVEVQTSIMKHELEFTDPDAFEVTNDFGSNTGTYEVTKSFVVCTYANGDTVDIPYEFNADGKIKLDCTTAFSVYK